MKETIQCPRCFEEYMVDSEKIPAKGGKITCKKCGFKIVVTKQPLAQETVKEESEKHPEAVTVACPQCGYNFEVSSREAPLSEDVNKKAILLIEDEAFFSGFAKDILEQKYRVFSAETLIDATSILLNEKIDLMLLDLVLKDGDGRNILKVIKKRCPIIIFTSKDEMDMLGDTWDELQSLGADDVIYKSMNLEDELNQKLERYLA